MYIYACIVELALNDHLPAGVRVCVSACMHVCECCLYERSKIPLCHVEDVYKIYVRKILVSTIKFIFTKRMS